MDGTEQLSELSPSSELSPLWAASKAPCVPVSLRICSMSRAKRARPRAQEGKVPLFGIVVIVSISLHRNEYFHLI